MIVRRSRSVLAAITAVLALVIQAQAGPENIVFPDDFANGVRWMVVNKPATKQVHELFAVPAAIQAAHRDQPMPSGVVFTLVRYAAHLNTQGSPIAGPGGFYLRAELLGFGVMEKRTGWGREYPDVLRNGEWEYRVFTADRKPDPSRSLTACFECHKSQANQDFVHAYDKLKHAGR